MRRRELSIATALVICTLLSGCDSDRLTQFGAFASAGTAYVTTFHTFTADVGSAYISADSATLMVARTQAGAGVTANAGVFRKNVADEDIALKDYLANLKKLDEHAALLGAYFAAITQLTNGKASSSTVTSIDGLADSINKFNPEIEKASFGGKNVKDYIGIVTPLVVDHFEVKALNEELIKSAPVIDKALALQEAAVAALSDQIKSSLAASLQVREAKDVLDPYVAAGALPSSWSASREAYVRQNLILDSADSAKSAVTSLHKAFSELVSNKAAKIDFSALTTAIGKMAGFVIAAKAAA
jgi:hypothetical protein